MTTNTAPNANTFDLDPPVRPSSVHFNGLAKQNAGGLAVKDPTTMLSSEEWNTAGHLHVALGKVAPSALLVIDNNAGRSILGVATPGSNIVAGSFLVTAVGAGNVQVSWATTGSAALPPLFAAKATAYEDAQVTSIRTFPFAAGAGRQGVQIKTDVAGVATSVRLLLEIH